MLVVQSRDPLPPSLCWVLVEPEFNEGVVLETIEADALLLGLFLLSFSSSAGAALPSAVAESLVAWSADESPDGADDVDLLALFSFDLAAILDLRLTTYTYRGKA